nr:MAG TPA: Protein of unknown function (DUF2023) [Caudoviricetes sp.]
MCYLSEKHKINKIKKGIRQFFLHTSSSVLCVLVCRG